MHLPSKMHDSVVCCIYIHIISFHNPYETLNSTCHLWRTFFLGIHISDRRTTTNESSPMATSMREFYVRRGSILCQKSPPAMVPDFLLFHGNHNPNSIAWELHLSSPPKVIYVPPYHASSHVWFPLNTKMFEFMPEWRSQEFGSDETTLIIITHHWKDCELMDCITTDLMMWCM